MLTFNNNIPATFFVVQQVGTMVQIKPFAGYYIWLDWFDLAPLDFSPAIDVLSGLISDVNDIATTALSEAATAAAAASTAQAAADAAQTTANTALAGNVAAAEYPSTHFINPRSTKVISIGFGAFQVATTDLGNGVYVMNGVNGEVEFKLPLNAGNYKLHIVYTRYSAAGNVELFMDTASIGTHQMYAAVTVRNFEFEFTLTSVTKGLHTFRLKIPSKAVASSGYNFACNMISLYEG